MILSQNTTDEVQIQIALHIFTRHTICHFSLSLSPFIIVDILCWFWKTCRIHDQVNNLYVFSTLSEKLAIFSN